MPRRLLGTVAIALVLGPLAASATPVPPAPPRRIAVLVGANEAPPGRATLRYAHDDVRALAGTLADVASFAPGDIHVLLDPEPGLVLRRLDAALDALAHGDEALLLFYYSGHSDTRALYPSGRPLLLDDLKRRLEDPRASVRVGVLDACSGGAWTGAKGLRPAEPFVVDVPFTLGAEGSVLLAASTGAEDAHEFERLGGSFFTHHLVAGLRGGADRNEDGLVSLDEAFEYAKAGTLRDTALFAAAPQHPSFVKNLRGRSDLPLARIEVAPTRVELQQQQGPLELIRLDRALVVLETPPGPRKLVLALQPGDYLVRRRETGRTYATEFTVPRGRTLSVSEESLSPREAPVLRAKATPALPETLLTSLPRGTWEAQLLVGNQFDQRVAVPRDGVWFAPGLAVGVTDRVQVTIWPLPQAAYRFGDPGGPEFLVSAGTDGIVLGRKDGLRALYPTASGLFRLPVSDRTIFNAGVAMTSSIYVSQPLGTRPRTVGDFEEWLLSIDGGLLLHPWERVWLAPALRVETDQGELLRDAGLSVTLGSSVDRRRGTHPLVQIELGQGFFLDGYGAVSVTGPPPLERRGRYGAGVSWIF